MAHNIGGNDQ